MAGDFYGVTGGGGAADQGTVFRMSASGAITTLHEFNGVDGGSPVAPLALGPDGKLYGLSFTSNSIYRISPQGQFMTLYQLQAPDGLQPVVGPTIGPDGMLYGATTQYGGAPGASGSVFQFDPLARQTATLAMQKICYNEFDMCFPIINTGVGQRYSVRWSSANLDSCQASGAWTGSKPPAGKLDVTPIKPGAYTYHLKCTGPSGPKSATVIVTVG